MGTGDYICLTLRGNAPWGFTLREGEGDTYKPFFVSQVEEGSRAFLAGVQEGDEVVALNGEPCADLTLLRASAIIDTSIDCLQLLLKRYCTIPPEDYESEETHCGQRDSSGVVLESTTLHIFSPKHGSQSPRELYTSVSQDEAYYGELDSDTFPRRPQLLSTERHVPSPGERGSREPVFKENDEEIQRCFSPGDMVELQVSLSKQSLDDVGCTSLGSALGIQGELSNREAIETIHNITTSHDVACSVREPLGQHGVVLSSPSMLGQVEVILQQPAASGAGRGILSVGGTRVSGSVGSQSEGEEEGGGHREGVPGSFTVSFGIASEEATPAEGQESDSEGDQDKPNKHRARHARLRRSESLSEKQVKEAKSKCKRIALLLTAAPPNPNNKGVLMFKKHRQRAKKYTLVSYGTGEDEPEYSDEEDEESEDDKQETHTVEFTLVAPNGSELDKHFLTNAHSSKGVLTINWDKGLLEIERNLNNQAEMECLPETKGKGALMFAQRRQRMDEISAEHEELRSHGIPVEGVPEPEKKILEQSYMQSTTDGHAYMDVNIHQQNQQQQQYQQYQEQQYYEQQQNYQQQQQNYQQQHQQQYQQQYQQQQQYEQQHYQQQQMYQQQQEYQQQQQMQHYSTNINGTVQHQTSEMQSSFSNRSAKPFSAENMVATPYSPAMSGTNQDSMGQGEQIASRDERISTPAIKTGFLMDARKRNTGKPMFTFKEAPKMTPNPALLNLLNRSDKKGFESGPEEDYLSLGAEACNFLQSPIKHKTPPPVAPKPVINPTSPPWASQIEMTNQDMPQQAENSVSTPAVAPTTEPTPAPELEPTPAPALEPSPPPATQEVPASTTTEEQHTEEQHTWTQQEPESQQQPLQVTAQEDYGHLNSTVQPKHSLKPQQILGPLKTSHPGISLKSKHKPKQMFSHPGLSLKSKHSLSHKFSHPGHILMISPICSKCNQLGVNPRINKCSSNPKPHGNSHHKHSLSINHHGYNNPSRNPQHNRLGFNRFNQNPSNNHHGCSSHSIRLHNNHGLSPKHQFSLNHLGFQLSLNSSSNLQLMHGLHHRLKPKFRPPWIQTAQAQPPGPPQASLNPWAPVPAHAHSQPSWAQSPPEHGQHPMSSWSQEQNQAQHQPPWAQPVPPQPTPQANWQQSSKPQPPLNTWPSPQIEPQTPVNVWAPQSQQTPVNFSTSMVNTRPSPKPWHPPQNAPENRTPPPPPQRMHSFTIGQKVSSPINPMATVLNPSSQGSSFEMPAVKGKGADMFAKRQSRMEKFVVDSETVQANKASRSTSPVASLPNEWKYTPNALGRSYSLSPPARVPFTGQKSASASASPKLPGRAFATPQAKQTSWLEKGHKPLTPWEAASRHPLGLVDEAFAFQDLQQTLVSNIHLAAQRKILPEPPAEWKARVSYQAPQKTGSHTWSQSQSRSRSRAPLPSFMSPTRSTVSIPDSNVGYRSLPRQWQPQRSAAEANLVPSLSYSEYKRPLGKQTYKSVYTSNTWSWKRHSHSPQPPPTHDKPQCRGASAPTRVALPCLTLSPLTFLTSYPEETSTAGDSPQRVLQDSHVTILHHDDQGEENTGGRQSAREIQGQEDAEMDLGKKVSVPKDIMLEELSFASNRGSRLFKMRQRRSEKYTYESIQNENNRQLNNTVVSQTENGNATGNQQTNDSGENKLDVDQSQVPSNTSNTTTVPNPDSIAPGYSGPLKDVPPEKFNSTAVPKSYHSPWEQAIINTPALADTLIASLPEPEARPDLPGYKSFNRVATPFGGFGKAPTTSFKTIQLEPLPDYPELQAEKAAVNRPTFNRSALGSLAVHWGFLKVRSQGNGTGSQRDVYRVSLQSWQSLFSSVSALKCTATSDSPRGFTLTETQPKKLLPGGYYRTFEGLLLSYSPALFSVQPGYNFTVDEPLRGTNHCS
ncbi:Synaptopodin-2 Myopodin [Larimichthys crocea]|uniref:Synaptopodin-2 Myopodin n=1 Tax=Larimichthys crocea TaxID=215358 RepID=A0A6G0HII2_LARCR|nr:Synaptopodin-2 Myopodin [Larimichthys crocea]